VLWLHNAAGVPVLFQLNGLEAGQWMDLIGSDHCIMGASGATTFALHPYQTEWPSSLLPRYSRYAPLAI
jgi:hypothetical protein